MIVYIHGSDGKPPVAEHTIIVAPAGHLPKAECLSEWWDASGERVVPAQFPVKFHYGEAEVDDQIGRYMVTTGQAMKSRLVLPNAWDR